MANFSRSTPISITLNLISSIIEFASLLFSICFLSFIIYQLIQNKCCYGRGKVGTPVILSINTLCLLIAKSLIQFIDINLNTFYRDIDVFSEENESFFCQFRGYTFFSVVSALYWSCALQAIFRFIRVLYSKCLLLHRPAIYLYVLIPGQIIFAFVGLLPHLLVFDAMRLIPDEVYCTAIMNDFFSLLYLFLMVFGLPLNCIIVCYICIIRKMRTSSFILPYRRRNRRDHIMITRIMIVIVILNVASLPAVINMIIYVPLGRLDPLIYRIEWISASVNALIFALSFPFINPQLLKILKKREKHNRCKMKLNSTNNTVLV